jgi:uncharacterized protein (TIGR02246 family)
MAEDDGGAAGRQVMRAAIPLAFLLVAGLPVHVAAQTAPPSIEERLRHAEDQLAIGRILIDYHWAMDARDFDAYVALFAKDGEWASGTQVHKGRQAIRKMMVGIFGATAGAPNRRSIEVTTNPEVNVTGDRATARSRHLLIWRGADGSPQPMLAGYYEDEFIREDGAWKILRRTDYPLMPTTEEWGGIMRARAAAK